MATISIIGFGGISRLKMQNPLDYFILSICRTVNNHCSSPPTGSSRAFRILASPPFPNAIAASPPAEIMYPVNIPRRGSCPTMSNDSSSGRLDMRDSSASILDPGVNSSHWTTIPRLPSALATIWAVSTDRAYGLVAMQPNTTSRDARNSATPRISVRPSPVSARPSSPRTEGTRFSALPCLRI